MKKRESAGFFGGTTGNLVAYSIIALKIAGYDVLLLRSQT